MILQRTEENGTINALYESSNVLASSYNKDKKELIITFNRGAQYVYAGVPATDYTRFEIDESQGKILNSHIKQYPFTSIGKVDVRELQNKIIDSLKKEISGFEKDLYDRMAESLQEMSKENDINFKMMDLGYMKRAIEKIIELKGQLSAKN